jgi:hypothetical protein
MLDKYNPVSIRMGNFNAHARRARNIRVPIPAPDAPWAWTRISRIGTN